MNTSSTGTGTGGRIRLLTLHGTVVCALVLAALVVDAGIVRTGITSGRITEFGSIWVNARELEVVTADIRINGASASESDLRLGHIVRVAALMDDELPVGEARQVIVEDLVQGPIDAIDAERDTIRVLGQLIHLDEFTVFELASEADSAEDLAIGEQVEVHGLRTSDGSFAASRVQDRSNPAQFEITGQVSQLAADSFALNQLVVAVNQFDASTLANGDVIEVRGRDFDSAGRLIAESLRPIDGPTVTVDDRGEVEGYVTGAAGAGRWIVDDYLVAIGPDTAFTGGGPANFGIDSRVEVVGSFDATGNLVAESVRIHGARIRVEGEISAIDGGALTVLGIDSSVDAGTKLVDKGPLRLDDLTMADLYVGDRVEILSVPVVDAAMPVPASLVRRTEADQDVVAQAFVSDVGAGRLSLMGAEVRWNRKTNFRDRNGARISEERFIASLAEGTLVKAAGVLGPSGEIVAKQLGYELD